MLRVVVHEKGGRTQRFNFEGDLFQVGREEDNDLVLDRANISKHHLRFRRADGKIEVVDLESTNGTYVNGRRVQAPRNVRRPDRIYVGDYILMLEGDDDAIAPVERKEIMVTGADGTPEVRRIDVPPLQQDANAPLPPPVTRSSSTDDDSGVMTSARRVPPAGVDSAYLDQVANRILQTVLTNVHALDPVHAAEIVPEAAKEAVTLVESIIADMGRAEELEEGVQIEALKSQVVRELIELGPLSELMADPDIREIQVVGSGPIRVVRDAVSEGAQAELTNRRFSGDRALVLVAQRLARKWGFLVEGTQVLEGKVDHGFTMYAVLPPTQLRAPIIHLRRAHSDANNLASLVQEGVLSGDMAEFIRAAIRGCRRILVCASGATDLDRFMGALVGEVPDELRVAAISDSGQVGRNRDGWAQVRRARDPSDALALSDTLGVILRGGIDLLVSQRTRHEDAAAVMDAFAGATRGAIVSLWGIDSAHGLWRLAGLSTVASGAIQSLTVSLARSVDVLIRLSVGVGGEAMQIIEVIEPRVPGGETIVHQPIFRAEKNADGVTRFVPTGEVPRLVEFLQAAGITVDRAIFSAPDGAKPKGDAGGA
ncbi:MAG: FHA domain-containing protein [Myxococcota bacterium]